jgi:hypothetical protein
MLDTQVWSYVSIVVLTAIALFQLIKDWSDYPRPVRWTVVALTVVSGATGIFLVRSQAKESSENQINIQSLTQSVKDEKADNTRNADRYFKSFDQLNSQFNDLQAKVRTQDLQQQLLDTRKQLLATQRALAPGPKASLTFTFSPFTNPPIGQPVVPSTDVTLPENIDGSIHIDFNILNLSDVDALDGEITLQICDQCKFAKEPPEFSKLAGQRDTQRLFLFQRILARVAHRTLSADVVAPSTAQSFTMGILYRCHTCTLTDKPSLGTVHISGRNGLR